MLAVAGRSPSDALVANTNSAQRWNGATWTALAPGQIGSVSDIWATAASYFTVSDFLSTFDGSTWMTVRPSPIASSKGLWIAPSGRAWIAGTGVQHLDGTTLTTDIATGTFNGIWGAGESDVFAVGLGDDSALRRQRVDRDDRPDDESAHRRVGPRERRRVRGRQHEHGTALPRRPLADVRDAVHRRPHERERRRARRSTRAPPTARSIA